MIRVEADNEAVMRSLVMAGGGVALMREDAALEAAAAGEVALWNKVRLETTLKFLHLKQREDDPEIRALLDVLHGSGRVRAGGRRRRTRLIARAVAATSPTTMIAGLAIPPSPHRSTTSSSVVATLAASRPRGVRDDRRPACAGMARGAQARREARAAARAHVDDERQAATRRARANRAPRRRPPRAPVTSATPCAQARCVTGIADLTPAPRAPT